MCHLPKIHRKVFKFSPTSYLALLLTSALCPLTEIHLESTVFVAFAGTELNIECELKMPANQSSDILTCSDPFHHQIYNCDIPATAGQPEVFKRRLQLKKLKSSGEYSCRYKTAEVYWFLRVRGEHKRRESE